LENQPEPSAAVSSPIDNLHVTKGSVVRRDAVFVKEAFLSFVGFDAVVAKMLDIAILPTGIVPFKSVPAVFSH
jgi:hypothetical protein